MFLKLILAIAFIGIVTLFVIGYEVRQIRKLKISEQDINDCFKDVESQKIANLILAKQDSNEIDSAIFTLRKIMKQ